MTLRVLEPGLYSLVVDLGRPRTRSLGVPIGGAADRTSLALGNALVGNASAAAALEITLAGPTLEAQCDLACVLYGAPFEAQCGLRALTPGKTFTLHADEVLRIGGTPAGMRAYLCVRGGIQGPRVLESRSALGPVRAGDLLPCVPGSIPGRFVKVQWDWDDQPHAAGPKLRVLDGLQADWFEAEALGTGPYTVTPASNRMGLRLQGQPLRLPERELLSEPVCPGAVQVTRDGQCIILGIDGQTIGGYPKVAQVISADLDALGQLRPGDQVAFAKVGVTVATDLYRRKMAELKGWLSRLETANMS